MRGNTGGIEYGVVDTSYCYLIVIIVITYCRRASWAAYAWLSSRMRLLGHEERSSTADAMAAPHPTATPLATEATTSVVNRYCREHSTLVSRCGPATKGSSHITSSTEARSFMDAAASTPRAKSLALAGRGAADAMVRVRQRAQRRRTWIYCTGCQDS